jgi:hypothetical protein
MRNAHVLVNLRGNGGSPHRQITLTGKGLRKRRIGELPRPVNLLERTRPASQIDFGMVI